MVGLLVAGAPGAAQPRAVRRRGRPERSRSRRSGESAATDSAVTKPVSGSRSAGGRLDEEGDRPARGLRKGETLVVIGIETGVRRAPSHARGP